MGRAGFHLGETLLLFGAFAIGAVLHGALVEHSFSLTSPVAVFGVLAGGALIGVGRRLERQNRQEIAPESEDDGETGDAEATEEFDEELAPFEMEQLEKHDRDDSR